MKKPIPQVMKVQTLFILAIASMAIFSSCKKDDIAPTSSPTSITTQINNFPIEPLSDNEVSSLIFMREEEKLAHDVYTTLYNVWGVNIFNNIAASEQTHTNSVLTLLNKYELTDPVGTNAVGVFSDSTLQSLYTQLVSQGSSSLMEGFMVGATIEDLDIYDLNNWALEIDNQDISFVYDNLNKGSRNHLRSFYSQIISSGGTYSAQFISQADFDLIVNSPNETGSW